MCCWSDVKILFGIINYTDLPTYDVFRAAFNSSQTIEPGRQLAPVLLLMYMCILESVN